MLSSDAAHIKSETLLDDGQEPLEDVVRRGMAAVGESSVALQIAMEHAKQAMSDLEKIEVCQARLCQIVSAGLYEEADGNVRESFSASENVEMMDKLLNAGHEKGVVRTAVETLKEDRALPAAAATK